MQKFDYYFYQKKTYLFSRPISLTNSVSTSLMSDDMQDAKLKSLLLCYSTVPLVGVEPGGFRMIAWGFL